MYSNYHSINKEDVLKDAPLFFQKSYQQDIVDLFIAATSEVVNVNVHIFPKEDSKRQVIDQPPHKQTSTTKDLYLLYHHTPNTNHLGGHYDTVLNISGKGTPAVPN